MSEPSINNKRIARNTLFMYFRMGIIMLVQLYTSRVVLTNLGIGNFGIYNVVGSLIVAFAFMRGPLSGATQRFLNYEMGVKTGGRPNLVFNVSVWVYSLIAIFLMIVLEIGGQWFIEHKMQIPIGRETATQFAFQISLISFLFNFLKTPYDALIIANERLSFYAILGLIEVFLKLLNAFSLSFFMVDKLELYALNHLGIDIILFLLFFFYTKCKLTAFRLNGEWDRKIFKELLQFTGWGLFGSFASMTTQQGINILLNVFCGVTINAAMGIAQQVNASVNGFVSNFQTAFRPQIVKSFAAEEREEMNKLVMRTSKFSYLLIFLIACPFCFNCNFILDIWLNNPPQFASDFCVLFMGYTLLAALGAPFWMVIYATGKIRNYQLLYSAICLLNIFFSYILLSIGMPPHVVLVIRIILECLIWAMRVWLVRKAVLFSIRIYLKSVLIPCFILTFLICLLQTPVCYLVDSGLQKLVVTGSIFLFVYPFSVFFLCLTQSERKLISEKICVAYHKIRI